ncbi:hypothetical protein H0S70_07235 [Chryseobacterium manosquense]|uniref:DUF4148 domain-containing protein n=1 Tax=Chryseobacterium manosquense TaxID=2754694 RepID=A0A7H1DT91_9FLAO|nr:hypothetical protein [Chryseobacterium manosquense]QNS40199.1 hypothetical protein H0S70_07235 [Chryseobacterium manosquense]
MKKSAGLILGMAAMLAGSGTIINIQSAPIETQKRVAEKATAPTQKPTEQKKEAKREYIRTVYRGQGIPPKVYGMNYVKRGTHKRTNV